MDKRLLSFATGVLITATTAMFLILPSWGASYAQNMAYELHPRGGLDIETFSSILCGTVVGRDDLFATLIVENDHPRPIQNVLFVTQDIDPNGMVESIEINANLTLPAAKPIEVGNKWEPLSSGTHTIEAFVWQMDSTSNGPPVALIEKQSLVVEVGTHC